MKIQLSQDEFYEIKMPDTIGLQEFQGIVAKFNLLLKNFTKFNIGEISPNEIIVNQSQIQKQQTHEIKQKQNTNQWKTLRDNRDITIDVLKSYYFGNFDDFENTLKKHNLFLKRADISSPLFKAVKNLHNIIPKELGLTQFPTINLPIHKCLINNTNGGVKQNE